MAKGHKPVSGSRAFWPRKRAKRIYPRVRSFVKEKEAVPLLFAGYKAGMTHVRFTDSRKGSVTEGQDVVKAVTVLDCPPLVVAGMKVYKKAAHGMVDFGTVWSEKLSKNLKRKTRVPKNPKPDFGEIEKNIEDIADIRLIVHTKPEESGIGKKKPELFEVSLGGDIKSKIEYAKKNLGGEIKVSDIFRPGELIDIKAVTKGKGYQGPVKRFGVTVRDRKAKKKRRHIGVLAPRNVARVRPGTVAMAGQLGYQTRTELNKKILLLGSAKENDINPRGGFLKYGIVRGDYILVSGSIPGPKKRLVMIRKALRGKKEPEPAEIKEISRESQQ